MTATVTGKTMQECLDRVAMLQRFGWAIEKPIHCVNGEWRVVLYLHV